MKTKFLSLALILSAGSTFSQHNYDFASSGQQKLLINPAFCAENGLSLQTVGAYHVSTPNPPGKIDLFSNYTGASFGFKNFGIGLSNTYYIRRFLYQGQTDSWRKSNKTDLSLAYTIHAGKKLSIVPSVQVSLSAERNYSSYYFHDYLSIPSTEERYRLIGVSSGLLADYNKVFTIGAGIYNIYSHTNTYPGLRLEPALWQVYHASVLLFKERHFNLQPYTILRLEADAMKDLEMGAYLSYKGFGLQAAYIYSEQMYLSNQVTAGFDYTFSKLKFGYTCNYQHNQPRSGIFYNELFVSAHFGKTPNKQKALMLN